MQTRTYTIATGDTLSAICAREYGDANLWPMLASVNRKAIEAAANARRDPNDRIELRMKPSPGPSPHAIYAGIEIILPAEADRLRRVSGWYG